MAQSRTIKLTANGRPYEGEVEPRRHLADFLRQDLGLTGTHVGCEHGVCGVCTVIVNGAALRSCLMFAVQVDDTDIQTVEGLSKADGSLHALQQAFRENHSLQCGFCTPGMLMTLVTFLDDHPDADEINIRDAISGNICRCTGYETIVDAAQQAANTLRGVP
jgi:aerobic-type carbon monoxide dehydrogenase small subunit (CoxS/CutS family)